MNQDPLIQAPFQKRLLIFSAWSSMFLFSELPNVICSTVFGKVPGWLLTGKVGFLALFLALCFLWKKMRALLPYAFIMLVFCAALAVSEWVRTSAWWNGFMSETRPSFAMTWSKPFIRDTGVALAVIAALWIVKRRRSAFFLVKGRFDAPVEPVRWLGIRQGGSWRTVGWIFALAASLGVAIPTMLAIRPSPDVLLHTAPLFPACVLLAALNAFNEEIYFRTTLLSTLPQVIGKTHALLINVVLFGLAHYLYGSPPGIIGFLMTGFLAWILGKSMLETKGFLWPWLIHFLPDVVIFYSYALSWVKQ